MLRGMGQTAKFGSGCLALAPVEREIGQSLADTSAPRTARVVRAGIGAPLPDPIRNWARYELLPEGPRCAEMYSRPMHEDAVRVVYDNQPYLVVRQPDGSLDRAYGPFTPGTEPSLAECGPENEIRSGSLLSTLEELLPISPPLPASDDTLASG